jgi:hypothetical protein
MTTAEPVTADVLEWRRGLPNAYAWEAEMADGAYVTVGESLAGCVRFSLLPQRPGLPRHDLVQVPMTRRFGRGFVRALGGGYREYLHCVVTPGFRLYVRSSDGSAIVTPPDFELYL